MAGGSGPALLRDGAKYIAKAAFGTKNLSTSTPVTSAHAIRARLLLSFSAADPLIPYAQAQQLVDAVRATSPAAYVDSMRLESGTVEFTHARVSHAAGSDYNERVGKLVAPFGRAPNTRPPAPSHWWFGPRT